MVYHDPQRFSALLDPPLLAPVKWRGEIARVSKRVNMRFQLPQRRPVRSIKYMNKNENKDRYVIIHLDGTIEIKESLTELIRSMESYRMY
jgi:hypothetical protein